MSFQLEQVNNKLKYDTNSILVTELKYDKY